MDHARRPHRPRAAGAVDTDQPDTPTRTILCLTQILVPPGSQFTTLGLTREVVIARDRGKVLHEPWAAWHRQQEMKIQMPARRLISRSMSASVTGFRPKANQAREAMIRAHPTIG